MADLGRILVGLGFALLVAGALLVLLGRTGLPLGRLPGDMHWSGRNWSIFAPLGTSLLLSIVLTVVLAIIRHLRR